MRVVSLAEYRRVIDRYPDREVALDVATLSESQVEDLATNAALALHTARVLYDAQAREMRRYGLDPIPVIGVRP